MSNFLPHLLKSLRTHRDSLPSEVFMRYLRLRYRRRHGGVASFARHLIATSASSNHRLVPLLTFRDCLKYSACADLISDPHKIVLSTSAIVFSPFLHSLNQLVFLHGSRGLRHGLKWSLPTVFIWLLFRLALRPRSIPVLSNSSVTSAVNYLAFGISSCPIGLPFHGSVASCIDRLPFPRRPVHSGSNFIIIYCGVVNHDKNISALLRVVELLELAGSQASILPIVPEDMLEQFKSLLEPCPRIISFSDLSVLDCCPVLVNPSIYEPFGYVFLEAISSCIPAICSSSAGIVEYSPVLPGLIAFDFSSANAYKSHGPSGSFNLRDQIIEARNRLIYGDDNLMQYKVLFETRLFSSIA